MASVRNVNVYLCLCYYIVLIINRSECMIFIKTSDSNLVTPCSLTMEL